ncbi:MAG TPA: hypothetical protein VK961_04075 [Chthoniobacter sp.]|nr:hypothetical protein [Chthoniobacter sp.]
MRYRSLFIRLGLAMVSVVLLCVLVYAGLGWVVWSSQPWLIGFLGKETFARWRTSYAEAATRLFPGDEDGDGVCDGLEFFYRTDPKISASHPHLTVLNSRGGGREEAKASYDIPMAHKLLVPWGAPMTAHCRLLVAGAEHSFPAHFSLHIRPPTPVAVALPGQPPRAKELIVPVNRNGEFSFDLQLLPWALQNPRSRTALMFGNASWTDLYGTFWVTSIWPETPISPTVQVNEPTRKDKYRLVGLHWPPVSSSAEAILLESREAVATAEWHPLLILAGPETNATVTQKVEGLFAPQVKELLYRVVPIHFEPPP